MRNLIKTMARRNRITRVLWWKFESLKFHRQKDVSLRVGNFNLVIPDKHPLPQILDSEPHREFALVTLAKLLLVKEQDEFIDVGANIGDSTALILSNGNSNARGHLVEPSDFYLKWLRRNAQAFANVEIYPLFMSTSNVLKDLPGYLNHWGGTAQFMTSTKKTISASKQISLSQIVNENTKLIKIDCDGLDDKILSSYIADIRENRPVIHYESFIRTNEDLSLARQVIERMFDLGYQNIVVLRNCGILLYSGNSHQQALDLLTAQLVTKLQGQANAFPNLDIVLIHNDLREVHVHLENELRSRMLMFR